MWSRFLRPLRSSSDLVNCCGIAIPIALDNSRKIFFWGRRRCCCCSGDDRQKTSGSLPWLRETETSIVLSSSSSLDLDFAWSPLAIIPFCIVDRRNGKPVSSWNNVKWLTLPTTLHYISHKNQVSPGAFPLLLIFAVVYYAVLLLFPFFFVLPPKRRVPRDRKYRFLKIRNTSEIYLWRTKRCCFVTLLFIQLYSYMTYQEMHANGPGTEAHKWWQREPMSHIFGPIMHLHPWIQTDLAMWFCFLFMCTVRVAIVKNVMCRMCKMQNSIHLCTMWALCTCTIKRHAALHKATYNLNSGHFTRSTHRIETDFVSRRWCVWHSKLWPR